MYVCEGVCRSMSKYVKVYVGVCEGVCRSMSMYVKVYVGVFVCM